MRYRELCSAGGLATLALVCTALASASSGRPAPQVRVAPIGQADLLDTGRLPVRLRLEGGGAVRVEARLRIGRRRTVRLVHPWTAALRGGHWRTVSFPLTASAETALHGCPRAHIVVTARRRHGSGTRSFKRTLRLDPPDCGRFFSPASFWNSSLENGAPLDPSSAAVTGELVREVNSGYQSSLPPTINTTAYTPPVYTVPAGQPRLSVHLDQPPGADPALAAAFGAVPLPGNANASPDGDAELVVWQPASDTLWEFWRLRRAADGWHATWGGRLEHASATAGVYTAPYPAWGASASSLSIAGGLITPRELARGRIDHALAIGVPDVRSRWFSLPAQRTDGDSTCASAVPEGAHFRLDPALDLGALGLPRPVAVLARAAQRYGIYIRDQSSAVAFYAQNASSLPANPYPALFGGREPWDLLRSFPWAHLELLKMSLRSMPGPAPLLPGGLPGACP